MKKKILFVLPNLKSGGAEKISVTLINSLKDYDIVLLLMNTNDLFYLNILNKNILIESLDYKRAADFFFYPNVFIKKIKFHKPNYIFSCYGEINPFVILYSLLFKKIIFIARETSIPSLRITKFYSKVLYFLTYRFYSKIIVQSLAMKKDLINNYYISNNKIELIYNPINIKILHKLDSSNYILNYEKGDSKLLLYIGSINKNKNLDKIIKFFELLKLEKLNVKLLIIGSGPSDDYINSLISKSNFRNLISKLSETIYAPLYLKIADYLIIASDYEGFPNVALESSYFGVPVILSDQTKGGATEFIVSDVNGFLLNFNNPDLNKFNISFDKNKIKENMLSKHSIDIFINNIEQLLN
jgi:glycosyltransferase involved in cell wall biosynthesis